MWSVIVYNKRKSYTCSNKRKLSSLEKQAVLCFLHICYSIGVATFISIIYIYTLLFYFYLANLYSPIHPLYQTFVPIHNSFYFFTSLLHSAVICNFLFPYFLLFLFFFFLLQKGIMKKDLTFSWNVHFAIFMGSKCRLKVLSYHPLLLPLIFLAGGHMDQ